MAPPPPPIEEFFHGALMDEDANRMLLRDSDYLVQSRYDATHVKPRLILAIRRPNQVIRVEIQRLNEGYSLGGHYSDSLQQLTEYFRKHPLMTSGAAVYLRRPIPRGKFQLAHNDVKLTKKIGSGAYGTVFSGILYPAQISVAVKRITPERRHDQYSVLVDMMKEARVMQLYDHPNIVRFHGFIVDRLPFMLVMELCRGGSIEDRLRDRPISMSTAKRIDMTAQAAEGLHYLHTKKCIHRDIAARNCLLTESDVVKLADFGMCRATIIYKVDLSKPMNVRWLAPEVWKTGETKFCTDVYAFGVFMWEMFIQPYDVPYSDMSAAKVKDSVMKGYRMPVPEEMPANVAAVMRSAWSQNSEERPSSADLAAKLRNIKLATQPASDSDNGRPATAFSPNLRTAYSPTPSLMGAPRRNPQPSRYTNLQRPR